MRSLTLGLLAASLSATAFAADPASVELTVVGLSQTQTSSTDKPDGGTSVKTTSTDLNTSPLNLKLDAYMNNMGMHYGITANSAGISGTFGAGYFVLQNLELGLDLAIAQTKSKDGSASEISKSTNGYYLYGRYAMPITESLSFRVVPKLGMTSGTSKGPVFDTATSTSSTVKTTDSGTGFGLDASLVHECASNIFYEFTLGYHASNSDNKTGSAKSKTAANTLTVTPLSFRAKI
jgi:hypothetical protein